MNETSAADMKITRFNVFNYQKKSKEMTVLVVQDEAPLDNESLVVADEDLESTTIDQNELVLRAKGGRPKDARVEKKRDFATVMVAARNVICTLYDKEKKKGRGKKRMKKGKLDDIIASVKARRNFPDTFTISPSLQERNLQHYSRLEWISLQRSMEQRMTLTSLRKTLDRANFILADQRVSSKGKKYHAW